MHHTRWIAAATATLAAFAGFQATAYASPAAHPDASPAGHQVAKVSYQRGIDLDFYWYPGMKVAADVSTDAKYAKALGANTVMFSIPFYTSIREPYAGSATPPPAQLAIAIRAARATGLQVGFRPLLDEANLNQKALNDPADSRTGFLPTNVAHWLAVYAKMVVPFARAAQQAGASRLWTGAELTRFGHDKGWAQVTKAVRGVFKGALLFAANWVTPNDLSRLPGSGGQGLTVTADAYPPMPYPLSKLPAQWAAKAKALPKGTVLTEVGIAALANAQYKPYAYKPSSAPLVPAVQVAWFNSACGAVVTDHLGGIYFWSVNVGRSLTIKPTRATPAEFTDSPGATAIKACFSKLGGS